jgi:hypothetical protein
MQGMAGRQVGRQSKAARPREVGRKISGKGRQAGRARQASRASQAR